MYRQSTSNARQSSVRLRYDRRHLMRMGAAGGALLAGGRRLTDPQHSVFAQADSGQLVISMFLEPTTLDPAQQVWVPGIVVLKNIIEPLIDLDDAGEAVPRLAESWEVSDDGTEWTWTLKEGITFHDGTPLDAEAVKFSFDRIMDPATQSQTGIALIGPYIGSEVIDARTVRMTYEEPYAPLLHNLSSVRPRHRLTDGRAGAR